MHSHKLEAKQLKENTFTDYAKWFQDMINRNLVSEISLLELKVLKGLSIGVLIMTNQKTVPPHLLDL